MKANSYSIRLSIMLLLFSLTACSGGGSGGSERAGESGGPGETEGRSVPSATFDSKVGQALLGPIVDANIEVYEVEAFDQAPFCTATSAGVSGELAPGTVDLSNCSFDDEELYYLTVEGGEDVDADDDGTYDDVPTPKHGVLHALLTGREINSGGWRINILTELAYQKLLPLLGSQSDVTRLIDSRNETAELVLNVDLNDDNVINGDDLAQFVPLGDRGALKNRNHELLLDIIASIHHGSVNIHELSRRYLLGQIDTFIFGEGDFAKFHGDRFVMRDGYQYHVGRLSNAEPSFDEGTVTVRILDAANPVNIQETGTLNIDGFNSDNYVGVHGLQLQGDYLYIALGEGGMVIVDISDPGDPLFVSRFDRRGWVDDLAVAGGTAFVATSDGLEVVDIGDPKAPFLINRIDGYSSAVEYGGGWLYVFGHGGEVQVFNASDPTNLVNVSSLNIDEAGIVEFSVHENILYATGNSGVHRFDVTDPANIQRLPHVGLPQGTSHLEFDGDEFFALGPNTLTVLRLAGLAEPSLLDSRYAPGPLGIAAADDVVYLLGGSRVAVFDRNSLNKAVENFLNVPTPNNARKVAVADGVLYVGDESDLILMDASNPHAMVEPLSTLPMGDYLLDFQVQNDLLYIANSVDGLAVVDVADPSNPMVLGSNDSLNEADYKETSLVAVEGDYAYTVLRTDSMLGIIDISDPKNPQVVSDEFDMQAPALDLAIAGDYLYIVHDDSFKILDMSNPIAPVELSNTSVVTESVHIDGSYAYLSRRPQGLQIIDVSNPSVPVILGEIPGLGQATDVTVHRQFAYVSNLFSRLGVFDVRDPNQPRFIGEMRVNGNLHDVTTDGDYLYMAHGFGVAIEKTLQRLSNLD